MGKIINSEVEMIFAADKPVTLLNTTKVLIIEDSLGYARFIYELLKIDDPYGFEIFHNVKLDSGLERLSKNDIDIILLDLGLPDCTGLETLVKVLNHVNNLIPVVIFSNRNDEDYIQEAIKLGAQDYLCKGEFDSRLLRHTLKAAIERKRLISELELQTEEIKLKKKKFELSETRFQKTIGSLPGLFIIYDSNKKIQYINNATAELYEPVFIMPEENKPFFKSLENCFTFQEEIVREQCLTVNNKKFFGLFNFLPVTDSDNNVHEVIVSSFNLSSYK